MSARPHEILNLKIKDIMFKKTEDGNRQYAEVLIKGGQNQTQNNPTYRLPPLCEGTDKYESQRL